MSATPEQPSSAAKPEARSASTEAVAAVMEVLGCKRRLAPAAVGWDCWRHALAWTRRGCPVAVAAADAAVAAATPHIAAKAYDDGYNDAATMARCYGHTDHWPTEDEPRNPYRIVHPKGVDHG